MRASVLLVAFLVASMAAPPARADWNTGDPYKWVQYPDLSTTGMDVNATAGQAGPPRYILADDFLCTVTSPITDIHVWGSWRYDYPPYGFDPGAVTFMISILSDIPAEESPTGYSMPGQVLWMREFGPGDFVVREWASNLQEWWWGGMEPPVFPGDSVCWQYNFFIPMADAFIQQGTPANAVVYWLALHARPEDPNPDTRFGWKTSSTHWNDDAVWKLLDEPSMLWQQLRYPFPHPLEGQQIDLAFVITEPSGTDWGDAPDPPYPTQAGASNGANHTIASGVYLGQTVDSEGNGQPDPNALGDDLTGADDEDGIVFLSPLTPGLAAQVQVQASAPGYLSGWIDFNGDGYWLSSQGDWVLTSQYVPAGTSVVSIPVPSAATPGIQTFARFRFTSQAWTPSPSGPAPDGEVEDYLVLIEGQEWKWIQTPDLGETGIDVNASQPFVLADDYLCESPGRITEIHIWGSWLNDYPPFGVAPAIPTFTLSIHADIPADTLAGTPSRPGEVLWTHMFGGGTYSASVWEDQIVEGWMTPPDQYSFPADWTCWLYTFSIPPEEAFHQVGMPGAGVVYWLDVQVMPIDSNARFGWKTSLDHWNDDAVWGQGGEPYPGPWAELRYPPQHQMSPRSIDLAFGLRSTHGTNVPGGDGPQPHRLLQSIPNPFNPMTTINYGVPTGGCHVAVDVYDVNGRHVRTLVDGFEDEGARSIVWDGTNDSGAAVPTGVYFCRTTAGGAHQTAKMTLLK